MKIHFYIYFFIAALIIASGCGGSDSTNKSPTDSTNENNSSVVMAPLVIASTDYQSITLQAPTFSTAGNPAPAITAYIAEDGDISVSGSAVSGYLDSYALAAADTKHTFSSLSSDTVYRVIVVAENVVGYSVRQIAQSTGGIGTVMDSLTLSATTSTSITLAQPIFSTAGNPTPTVTAYIGYTTGANAITVNYLTGVVTNDLANIDVNVSVFPYTFGGLGANTAYKIIVVAQNSSGPSIREITGTTLP